MLVIYSWVLKKKSSLSRTDEARVVPLCRPVSRPAWAGSHRGRRIHGDSTCVDRALSRWGDRGKSLGGLSASGSFAMHLLLACGPAPDRARPEREGPAGIFFIIAAGCGPHQCPCLAELLSHVAEAASRLCSDRIKHKWTSNRSSARARGEHDPPEHDDHHLHPATRLSTVTIRPTRVWPAAAHHQMRPPSRPGPRVSFFFADLRFGLTA